MRSRIINIFVASPSDTKKERELLIIKLPYFFHRYKYEEFCDTRIIVKGWEDVPSQSGFAQDIINSELLINIDILIAIFKHKLGQPIVDVNTGKERSISGSVEELNYAIKQNENNKKPLAMVYFYKHPPEKENKEWEKLEEYKKVISTKVIYDLYNDNEELFLINLCKDICEHIQKHPILNNE